MTPYLGGWIALLTIPGVILLAIARADRWLDWRRARREMHRQVDETLADANTRRSATDSGLFAIHPEETDPS